MKNNNKNCCKQKPIIKLPAGKKLCNTHFTEYFENKVFKTIRQFDLIGKEENLGIALSGGKDSLTLLHLLNKLSKQNKKIKLTAILIDEGIKGYRGKTTEIAKKFCKKNKVPLKIYSFEEEFGISLDDMLKTLDVKPCTICGIFRRYLLNKKSKELKFTKLATGHNLDDETQSILMNQFKNNIQASARLGPKSGVKDNKNFVQRIKPLYLCAEKEVATYAFVNNLLDNFTECPNILKSYRAQVRDMLNNFELKNEGTKHAIANSFLDILPKLKEKFKDGKINFCKKCGEPSAKEKCNKCKLIDKMKKSEKK
ncbi:TIGR00269 family protein [Candidatus Woesearchaeota archaeon]|nr:TIGR00269 family protein [Candidatus Woesearchaeota archaeon]|tara:strand:+ start:17087 stop:18019 length:933 start_codon:yes stop_codon:yes gene_type:complete